MWGANGADVGSSHYREIDVYEFGTPGCADHVLMTLHVGRDIDGGSSIAGGYDRCGKNFGYSVNKALGTNDYAGTYDFYSANGDTLSNSFHTYAVKWMPDAVTWYVDDRQVYQVVGHSPHEEMTLMAGMGIHTDYRTPDALLPAAYEIDYIRVYQTSVDILPPIEGSAEFCKSAPAVYSAGATPGISSYTWSVPAGWKVNGVAVNCGSASCPLTLPAPTGSSVSLGAPDGTTGDVTGTIQVYGTLAAGKDTTPQSKKITINNQAPIDIAKVHPMVSVAVPGRTADPILRGDRNISGVPPPRVFV